MSKNITPWVRIFLLSPSFQYSIVNVSWFYNEAQQVSNLRNQEYFSFTTAASIDCGRKPASMDGKLIKIFRFPADFPLSTPCLRWLACQCSIMTQEPLASTVPLALSFMLPSSPPRSGKACQPAVQTVTDFLRAPATLMLSVIVFVGH